MNEELIDLEGNVSQWSENGLFIVSGLQKSVPLPGAFSLGDAYPNPFNPVTSINFAVPVESDISIQVYNIQGRVIETLVHDIMEAGYHTVTWHADDHSSGIYFVKMISGEYVKTQKLMLVK